MDYQTEIRERLLYPDSDILAAVIARLKEDAKEEFPWFCSSETSDVTNAAVEDECQEDIRVFQASQKCPFLCTKQAAHILSLSSRTLEKMRGTAKGPFFRRHGRYIRYHIDDIMTWSEEHRYLSISDKSNFISVKPLSKSVP
jgi:hypothetical protein